MVSSSSGNPMQAIISPQIAFGYWSVDRVIPFFRWLGRKLHSKHVYWLGFQVRWQAGLLDGIDKEFAWKWYGGYGQYNEIGKIMAESIDDLAKSKKP